MLAQRLERKMRRGIYAGAAYRKGSGQDGRERWSDDSTGSNLCDPQPNVQPDRANRQRSRVNARSTPKASRGAGPVDCIFALRSRCSRVTGTLRQSSTTWVARPA